MKTQQSQVILDFAGGAHDQELKSHSYRDTIVFEKLRIQNIFFPPDNEKLALSSQLKSVFENLSFVTD